jgi:F-type H+-transporting ATPase subunit alpha
MFARPALLRRVVTNKPASRALFLCSKQAPCVTAVCNASRTASAHGYSKRHAHSTRESTLFALEDEINSAFANVESENVAAQTQGHVIETRENVACVAGLEGASMGSLVRFARNGSLGMVMSLERQIVRVAPLQNKFVVRRSDVVEMIPNGQATADAEDELISLVTKSTTRPLHLHARTPPMLDWANNLLPWVTGLLAVDVSYPLQLGQRVGVVGPKLSGKRKLASFLALSCLQDAQTLPKDVGVTRPKHVVWVSIGKDTSADVAAALGSVDVSDRFDVVFANQDSTPVMQYLAPHVGVALAETKRAAGEHVLLVIDNVSAHGNAYETMAKAGIPDGHGTKKVISTSQPMDSVLSRCGPFKQSAGGGSVTCLAILDTDESDASQRSKDLLSITADSTIPMSPELAVRRLFPAIDCAKRGMQSLGTRQNSALRKVSNKLRDLLWTVRGKAVIAQVQAKFGIKPEYDLDTQFAVEMDAKLKTLFTQDNSGLKTTPYSLPEELVLVTLAADGLLEHVKEAHVSDYRAWILKRMGEKSTTNGQEAGVSMLELLTTHLAAFGGELSDDVAAMLKTALRNETKVFVQEHSQ